MVGTDEIAKFIFETFKWEHKQVLTCRRCHVVKLKVTLYIHSI